MAKTYFDRREGREKSLPDCWRHGLAWDEQTQRCEYHGQGLLGQLYNRLFINGDGYDYGYDEPIYYEPPPSQPAPVPVPAPTPTPEPPPVYTPAPVYQPVYEPVSHDGLAYYEAPEPFYEPVYVEPAPVYFDLPYVELEPIKEEQAFFALPPPPEPLPVPAPTPAPAYNDWAFCANEYQRCNFSDTREVRYGKGSTWTAPRQFTGGVDCSNAVFGDPLYGTVKECQTRAVIQPEPATTQILVAEPDWPTAPVPSEPVTMAEDFYLNDYGGGFYNGGGGGFAPIDYAPYEPVPLEPPVFEPLPTFPTFEEIPFAPYEPVPLEPPVFDTFPEGPYFELPYLPYEPVPLEPPVFETLPEYPRSAGEVYSDLYEYYLSIGVDPFAASSLAEQEAEAITGGIVIPDIAPTPTAPPPVLPELPPYTPIPYSTPFTPWETPPIIPELEIYFPLPPPPPKLGPCNTPDGLPPYCPTGTYHPTWDPCSCVPFPPAQPSQQRPRPDAPTTQSPAPKPPTQQQSKPPSQQQPCPPTTHWMNPVTRRCEEIPKCRAPLVFDQRTARCVPASQAQQPSTNTQEEPDKEKSNWLMWALIAGVGVIVLSDSGGGGKRR